MISRPSDLLNRFGLLSAYSGCDVSSLCDPPVLLDRAISQAVLSDLGIVVSAGVHFDVSGKILYPGGDEDRLLVTTPTCVLAGGLCVAVIGCIS